MSRLAADRLAQLLTTGACVVAVAVAGSLLAFWSSGGSNSAAVRVATLAAPSIASATPGSGSVSLAWSVVTAPGPGAVAYSVERGSGAAGGSCPTSVVPAEITSCTDSGLTPGTYAYTVTARWRGWTATSAVVPVTVTAALATHLVLTPATTAGTAGVAVGLTITARDGAGATATSYNGPRTLTFAGATAIGSLQPTVSDSTGTAIPFGTATTLTFTNGVATVFGSGNGVMRLYRAGSASIVVGDGTISNGAGTLVTVGPGPAAQLGFTQQPGDSTAGVAFATQPWVAIQDAFGNTVPSATNPVALALTSPGAATLACPLNPVPASGGVASFAGCAIDLAGAYTLTASAGGLAPAQSDAFAVDTASIVTSRASGSWDDVDTWTALGRTGSISSTTNSPTVTGNGTHFLTELAVGDRLLRSNGRTSIGLVQSIESETSLTLASDASNHNASAGFSARSVPTVAEAVSVEGTHAITIPAAYAAVANSLTIGSAANRSTQTVTLAAATSSLTTTGDLTLVSPKGNATRTLAINGGTLAVGDRLSLMAGAQSNAAGRVNRVTLTTGTATIGGDLIFNAGDVDNPSATQSQLTISEAGTVELGGAFTVNGGGGTPAGTLAPGTASTFDFDGAAAQTIPLDVTGIAYANLTTSNTSETGAVLGAAISPANVAGDLRVLGGSLRNAGFSIDLAPSKAFELADSATFVATGTTGMVTGSSVTKTFGVSSTVSYAGVAQTVSDETYGNLELAGSGTKTLPVTGPTIAGDLDLAGTAAATAVAPLTIGGNLTIAAGATLDASSFSHVVGGSFSSDGTFVAGTSTFTFAGAGAGSIGGTASPTFDNLTVAGAAGLSLDGVDATVSGTLALGANLLMTGPNRLIAAGAVTRTTGFVAGNLQKPLASGSATAFFEIGSGTTYTPVSVDLVDASAAGSLTASSVAGPPPNTAGSGLSTTQYVNRTWTLTAGDGLTATSYRATFGFVAADLVGSPDTATLVVRRYVAPGAWTAASSPSSTATSVSGEFTGAFGEYAAAAPGE